MSLITEKDTFVEYFYNISEFYIIIDSETIKLPTERLTDFKIEHYFDEAVFPIFKVTMTLEPSRYYKIIKNKDKVKFKLRLQSWYRKKGTDEDSLVRDVINDTFSIFINDDNDDYQKSLKKSAGTDKDENELDRLKNDIEFFLFKTSLVTGLRSNIQAVLQDVDLTTAIAYLLSKAGANKVLLSPLDNKSTYETLVLPPQNIEKQLKYLNNNYGFHKNGSIIYFGLFNSYILNCKEGCTAWAKNEWKETILYVLDKTSSDSYLEGAILKQGEKRFYYNMKAEGVDTTNNSVTTNAITGSDAIVVDMASNSSSSVKSSSKIIGKSTEAVLFNNTSNKYMGTTFAAQQKANSTVVTLLLSNLNLEAFKPNKSISMIFEDATLNKKYKGLYRVSSAIYTFKNSGDNYSVTAIITLKKVK